MTKVQEVVRREEWFPPEYFDRAEAIDSVEADLRDRHDVQGDVDVEVTKQRSDEWRVQVTGRLVDEDGGEA